MIGTAPRIASRGSAMVLVLLAIALAFVMGLTFLATSSTLTQSAETMADHARARQIAESGLLIAIQYVQENPDWHVRRNDGTWIDNHAIHGGSVTVTGHSTGGRFDPLRLAAEGRYGGARHRVEAALVSEHQPFGFAVSAAVQLSNNTIIDSYNSAEGPYGTGDMDDALVSTNTTAAGGVSLQHTSMIRGSVYVGKGGNPSTVISHPAKVTGVKAALQYAMDFPSPAAMPAITDHYGDQTYSGGTVTISEDRRYGRLDISGGTVRITDHVTIRVDNDFNVVNTGTLVIDDGASLRIYVGEDILFQNSARVNAGGDPVQLTVFGIGSNQLHVIQNSAIFSGIFDAPTSGLKVQNEVNFYGVAMIDRLEAQNDIGGIHIDRNPALIEANPRLRSRVAGGVGTFRVVSWTDH